MHFFDSQPSSDLIVRKWKDTRQWSGLHRAKCERQRRIGPALESVKRHRLHWKPHQQLAIVRLKCVRRKVPISLTTLEQVEISNGHEMTAANRRRII